MEDFYEALVGPASLVDRLADSDLVPWSIVLAPAAPVRTGRGRSR
jgi:hypothetical protein